MISAILLDPSRACQISVAMRFRRSPSPSSRSPRPASSSITRHANCSLLARRLSSCIPGPYPREHSSRRRRETSHTVPQLSGQEAGRLPVMAGGLVQVSPLEIEATKGQIEPSRADAMPPCRFIRRQCIVPAPPYGIDVSQPILSRPLALFGSRSHCELRFSRGPVSKLDVRAPQSQMGPAVIRFQLARSPIVSQGLVPAPLPRGEIRQPAVGTGVVQIEGQDLSILDG